MIICYLIIAAYAVWTCNSTRFDDGIVGKIAYCGLALAAVGLAYQPDEIQTQKILNISIAVICVRQFLRHTIYPYVFKKYKKLDRRNNGSND